LHARAQISELHEIVQPPPARPRSRETPDPQAGSASARRRG